MAATFGAGEISELKTSSQANWKEFQVIERKYSVKNKRGKNQKCTPNQLPSTRSSKVEHYDRYSVEDRTLLWEKNRQNRIQQIQESKKDSELTECTFKPLLSARPDDYLKGARKIEGKVNISAIDKYISRMYSARIERENKKFEQDNAIGSGKNWKKQITVPNPPKLSQK